MHEVQCPAVWAVCADGVKVLGFLSSGFFHCWREQIAKSSCKIFIGMLQFKKKRKIPVFPPQIMNFSGSVIVCVCACVCEGCIPSCGSRQYDLHLITTELQTPVNWSISCCASIQFTDTHTHTHICSHKMPSRQSWSCCTGKPMFIACIYSLLVWFIYSFYWTLHLSIEKFVCAKVSKSMEGCLWRCSKVRFGAVCAEDRQRAALPSLLPSPQRWC